LIYEKEKLQEKVVDLEQMVREWAQKFIDLADKQKFIQHTHSNYVRQLKQQYKQATLTSCIDQMHFEQCQDITRSLPETSEYGRW
jgi:hypothetical protein